MKTAGNKPKPRKNAAPGALSPAGFTLVELLMAIAIISILFSTVYRSFDIFRRSYATENVKAGVQQEARIGVGIMAQDIRMAGLDPMGTAGAGIVAANPASIQFTADLNYDGDLADANENITYALNGSRLVQTNHLGTETLLDDVTALSFTYLDADNNPAAAPSDIRTVVIALTVQRPAGREGMVSRTYTTRIRCRNL